MMFERNPNSPQPQVRTMWEGGPDRLVSEVRCSGAPDAYAEGGYAGNYVCQGCQAPSQGVYRVKPRLEVAKKWLCASCVDIEFPPVPRKGKK